MQVIDQAPADGGVLGSNFIQTLVYKTYIKYVNYLRRCTSEGRTPLEFKLFVKKGEDVMNKFFYMTIASYSQFVDSLSKGDLQEAFKFTKYVYKYQNILSLTLPDAEGFWSDSDVNKSYKYADELREVNQITLSQAFKEWDTDGDNPRPTFFLSCLVLKGKGSNLSRRVMDLVDARDSRNARIKLRNDIMSGTFDRV